MEERKERAMWRGEKKKHTHTNSGAGAEGQGGSKGMREHRQRVGRRKIKTPTCRHKSLAKLAKSHFFLQLLSVPVGKEA